MLDIIYYIHVKFFITVKAYYILSQKLCCIAFTYDAIYLIVYI